MLLDRNGAHDMEPSIITVPFTRRGPSAIDPRGEEISWAALRVNALALRDDQDLANAAEVGAERMHRVVEAHWRPGQSLLMIDVTKSSGDPQVPLDITMAIGTIGTAGCSKRDLEPILTAMERATSIGRARHVIRVHPGRLIAALNGDGPFERNRYHCVHLRQPVLILGDDDHTIEIPTRFHPWSQPWSRVAELVTDHHAPITVRATLMATAPGLVEQQQLQRTLHTIGDWKLRNDTSIDVHHDAGRAAATLIEFLTSLRSPTFICEIAVLSPEPLGEATLRSVAGAFTSEFDLTHQGGRVNVGAGISFAGGFELDHNPEAWEHAFHLGVPLRGGLLASSLRDTVSLTEAPVTLPIAGITPLGNLPTMIPADQPVPEILRPDPSIPATVLGTTLHGEIVALPWNLRTLHTFITGLWGKGKSTLQVALAHADLRSGRPIWFLDPHGTAHADLVGHALALGLDPIIIDATDGRTAQLSLLPALTNEPGSRERFEVASNRLVEGIMSSLPHDWTGPMFFTILSSALEVGGACGAALHETFSWLTNPSELLKRAKHPLVSDRARQSLATLAGSSDHAREIGLWVSSKGHAFVNGASRRILGSAGIGVNLADAALSGRPVLLSLAGLSSSEASLIGHLLIEQVLNVAITRPISERTNVATLYVDEAHRFPPSGLSRIVAEARKFGIGLVASTQAYSQLSPELTDLSEGAGVTVTFCTTPDSARRLSDKTGLQSRTLTALPTFTCVVSVQGHDSITIQIPPPEPVATPYEPAPLLSGDPMVAPSSCSMTETTALQVDRIVPSKDPSPGKHGEKGNFTVILSDAGATKVGVIKVVRSLSQRGLKDTVQLVNTAPQPILEQVSKDLADRARQALEAHGATVEIHEVEHGA